MKAKLLLILTAAIVCLGSQAARAQITPYRDGKRAALSFTYDDGYLEHLTLVAPELEKRGFRGTYWIIGSMVGNTDNKYGPRLTWQQIGELARRGHDVGSHTWSHPHLKRINDADSIRREFTRLDSAFAANGLPRPLDVAYPYNGHTPLIEAIAEEGRIGSRTRQVGHGEKNNKVTPEKLSAWLSGIIERGEWGITMTHGITCGYDMWYHPEWLWAFYDTVQAHSADVWVATFAEVEAYRKERAHCHLSIVGRRHRLQVTPVLEGLDPALFSVPLTLRLPLSSLRHSRRHEVCQDGSSLPFLLVADSLQFNFSPSGGPVTVR